MKATIIGYGKMGREIAQLLPSVGLELATTIDNETEWQEREKLFQTSDVAIEFSTPATVVGNLRRCFEAGVPVVCGTTGWGNQQAEILQRCQQTSNALIYGSNFSIGANLFFKINEMVAAMMNQQPQYEVRVDEIHHAAKQDAPSGTAITIAQQLVSMLDRKNGWKLADEVATDEISVRAHRIGTEPGTHGVCYTSANDSIELVHRAGNRSIFAQGAVRAARWLVDHRGIYNFHDIFMEL